MAKLLDCAVCVVFCVVYLRAELGKSWYEISGFGAPKPVALRQGANVFPSPTAL